MNRRNCLSTGRASGPFSSAGRRCSAVSPRGLPEQAAPWSPVCPAPVACQQSHVCRSSWAGLPDSPMSCSLHDSPGKACKRLRGHVIRQLFIKCSRNPPILVMNILSCSLVVSRDTEQRPSTGASMPWWAACGHGPLQAASRAWGCSWLLPLGLLSPPHPRGTAQSQLPQAPSCRCPPSSSVTFQKVSDLKTPRWTY